MRGAGPAGSPGRSQCTVLPPGGGGFPLFGPHVLKKDRTGGAAAKTRAERHDTAREERAVRVQARGPHEGERRLAGSCGARRFRVLPDALASAAERAVACGQFDDLGLPCVSHYVAEAPQEFEALLDGPQEPEHEMAQDRPPLTKWAIRRPRLAVRVALCGGSAPGVRGAARWTASGRGENGAGTHRLASVWLKAQRSTPMPSPRIRAAHLRRRRASRTSRRWRGWEYYHGPSSRRQTTND